MVSQELKDAVQSYRDYINVNGLDEDAIEALLSACRTAYDKEKDKEYALRLSSEIKCIFDEYIKQQTGADFYALERYANENNLKYHIVDSYWEVLRLEARHKFESFCLYMEKNRDYTKRFYQPRMQTLGQVVGDLEDLYNRKIKFLGLSMPSRTGKLISDDTPVLTENGWKKHGDLEVGDYVYDFDGQLVKVIYVHPKQYANKRVWFSDHTYIDCHENHEWVMYDRNGNREITAETKYIEQNLCSKENGKERNRWFLPLKKPLNGTMNKNLKVPPYVLGAWLGDGTNRKPVITICDTDNEILDEVKRSYECTASHKQVGCTAYSFSGLRKDLQHYGMCMRNYATDKHIPDEYLTAHPIQRLELLAGLLDTDGCLRKKERRYNFSTISERLKDDVVSLISTFGWRVCVTKQEPTLSSGGIQGKNVCYTISFNPTFEIPCRVERKQLKEFSKQRRISVEKIEDIEPIQGNCITVMGGIYRVGRRMTPTHNSTLCIFFLAWLMGNRPNSHSAMGGHSGILAKGFYGELLNLIGTEEYTYVEIFPKLVHRRNKDSDNQVIQRKSADEFTINLGKPDRFATMTCRGIDGTWTGAIDVSLDGILYVDDLVRDREHSLSPSRMESTYQEYLNKMVDRKSGADPGDGTFAGACELMVGTLWNVLDPLERLRQEYEGNPLYRFRKIPALDENDESNFDYEVNGFSTEYYREMRERLDNAEWMAKYQQQPYVREGLLFPLDELRYFNGILPEGDSRIVSVCDVAWGGGDSLSMPIGREYENGDVYIFDWIFNKGAKEQTIPLVVGKIMENEIRQVRFEGNVGGAMYSSYVDEELQKYDYKCNCTEKKAPNRMSKLEKIMAYSGDIKRKFIFLAPNGQLAKDDGTTKRYKRSAEYQAAMDEVGMFVTIGKNKHDDAADSLTQLSMFIEGDSGVSTVQAIKNPFKRGF